MASLNEHDEKLKKHDYLLSAIKDVPDHWGIGLNNCAIYVRNDNEINFNSSNNQILFNYRTMSGQTQPINKFYFLAGIGSSGGREARGDIVCNNIDCYDIDANNITAAKVYNAVWNDYAEFYPKGEETEAGDIIMLDINSKEEKYVKATEGSTTVVGVHSDTYGHLIGGEEAPDGREFVEYNSKKYIPVGLVGRVYCKVIGKINKGDRIVVSEIAGVGRKFDSERDNVFQIVGMSVENKESLQIGKIKVNFRAGGGGVNSHYLSHFAPLNFLEVTNG